MNLKERFQFPGHQPLGIGFTRSFQKRNYNLEVLNFPHGLGSNGNPIVSKQHKMYKSLQPGDILATINGESVENLSFENVIEKLKQRNLETTMSLEFYQPIPCAHVIRVPILSKNKPLGVIFKRSEHAIFSCQVDQIQPDQAISKFNQMAKYPVQQTMVLTRINRKSTAKLPFTLVIKLLEATDDLSLVFQVPSVIHMSNPPVLIPTSCSTWRFKAESQDGSMVLQQIDEENVMDWSFEKIQERITSSKFSKVVLASWYEEEDQEGIDDDWCVI